MSVPCLFQFTRVTKSCGCAGGIWAKAAQGKRRNWKKKKNQHTKNVKILTMKDAKQ